jgi:hypothetical protein
MLQCAAFSVGDLKRTTSAFCQTALFLLTAKKLFSQIQNNAANRLMFNWDGG